MTLKYFCDSQRHLVCMPYSNENLHMMAEDLGIVRAWFHNSPSGAHYDIPKKRIAEISAKCTIVSPREILKICKSMDESRLLREYIQLLLNEDEASSIAGGDMGSPYGMAYASKEELWNSFIKPFTDVASVAAGKGKELAVKGKSTLKTVIAGIGSVLIPALSANYEKIYATEKQQLDAIKHQYKDVYNATWQAFNHSDVKFLAFLYDPFATGAMLTYFGGKAGYNKAIDVANIISGGALEKVKANMEKNAIPPTVYKGGATDESKQIKEAKVRDLLGSAMDSFQARKMRADAQKIVQGSLNQVVVQAQRIAAAKSLDQLPTPPPPEARAKLQQVPEQERAQAEGEILDVIKKAAQKMYLTNLETQLKTALQQGVPQSSAYVKDYASTIKKIKAIA